MNRLRDLLDAIAERRTYYRSEAQLGPEHSAATAQEVAAAVGKEAVCFWLGDVERLQDFCAITELCRLPYPTCWFELEIRSQEYIAPVGVLAYSLEDGTFEAQVWVKWHGRWVIQGAIAADRFDSDERLICVDAEPARWWVVMACAAVRAFLSALHCSNVVRQMHEPDPKLQCARARRGKAPLFSYWTLQLNQPTSGGEAVGGTHASPRLHLRRGHPRQYRKGSWTWVQAHVVGNKAAGIVHKDYSAGTVLDAMNAKESTLEEKKSD